MSIIDRTIYGKRKQKRGVFSAPADNVISGEALVQAAQSADTLSTVQGKDISTATLADAPVNAMANDDPGKRRLANSPGRMWLSRIRHKLAFIFAPKAPTKEELAAMDDKQKLAALSRPVLLPEAQTAEKRMINCLTRLGVCYVTRNNENKVKSVKAVRFDKIKLGLDATHFHIDTDRLPWGVSIAQLQSQEVVDNLSVAVNHKINYRRFEETGCWYIMERASGTMGIPNHVNLVDIWERTPASKGSLTIPIGMTHNSRPVYEDLDDMVHLLIAGTTGGGKSNFLNMALCTLIKNNKPSRLRMLLVDLKGGLEFNYYDGIPHLLPIPAAPKGIVYERDDVPGLLKWVILEGERRMAILLKAEAKNIGEFNSRKLDNHRMPHLLVVIDEWADVKLGEDGKKTENMLANSVQRMRAVGIHVIVCTQVPQREVLGTLIKANLPAKLAFSCADLQGSMSILNNGHALNLQPKGRCIFRFREEIDVQTPFIPKTLIHEIVKGAKEGKVNELRKFDVTEDEVLEWALHENNGWLPVDTVYNHFKQRGLPKGVCENWLKAFEENDFLIGNQTYHVDKGDYHHARRLIAKTDVVEPNPVPRESSNDPETERPEASVLSPES